MSDAVTELPGADIGSENYAALVARLAEAERLSTNLNESLDSLLTVLSVVSAFLIIVGIALLEKSYFRYATMHNLIIKQLIILTVGFLTWCTIGYTIAFGTGESKNKFMGTTNLFSFGLWDEPQKLRLLVYEGLCSVFPSSLMNSCLGERAQFRGIFLSTVILGGVIYPVAARAVRSDYGLLTDITQAANDGDGPGGWIGNPPYYDYGNTLVHALGGTAAALAVGLTNGFSGPRWARNPAKPVDLHHWGKADSGDNHLQCVATFFFLAGWTFFTIGGRHSFHDEASAYHAVRAAANLILASCATGLFSLFSFQIMLCGGHPPDVGVLCCAMRAGLVGMTTSAAIYSPVGAFMMAAWTAFCIPVSWALMNDGIDEVGGFASSHCPPAVFGLMSPILGDTDMVTVGVGLLVHFVGTIMLEVYILITTFLMLALMLYIDWLNLTHDQQRLAYDPALQNPPQSGQPPPTTVGRAFGSQ